MLLVLSLTATAAVADSTKAASGPSGLYYPQKDGPFGYGVFQKMHYRDFTQAPTRNIGNPYLAGVEIVFNWADLEPREGVYRWETVDRFMQPWIQSGRKIILGVRAIQKRGASATAGAATPAWVFEAGAKKIATGPFTGGKKSKKTPGPTDGTKNDNESASEVSWPIYWDPVYLKKYQRFVSAFADRYDGNPGIEFIEIGLGQFGSTKIAGPAHVYRLYRDEGYTEDRWVETIQKIIEIYRQAFEKTPMAIVMSPFHKVKKDSGGDRLKALAVYAADRGIYLYNHALTGTDEFVKENPFPAVFNSVHDRTRTAFGPDNPISATGGQNDRKYGGIRDAVANALGDIHGLPRTHISYLIFYADDISAATSGSPEYQKEFEEAIRFGLEAIRPKEMKGESPVHGGRNETP